MRSPRLALDAWVAELQRQTAELLGIVTPLRRRKRKKA